MLCLCLCLCFLFDCMYVCVIEMIERDPKKMLRECDDPDLECIICFDNEPNARLEPCGHSHFCAQCLFDQNIKTCPICRTTISKKIKI